VQCTSCHDPHIRDSDITKNIKFLRLHRLQEGFPAGGNFDSANDIICLACHDKLGLAWAQSAHADPLAADETYTAAAANLREFPLNTPVWQASCLNCHDTHTVQGARHLLREGTDSPVSPKTGGSAALEEACYTCHSADGGVLNGQGGGSFQVPDIKTDFTTGLTHMPIDNSDQQTTEEIHTALDADLFESAANLNNANRHVECTDCHNPHRVLKNRLFNNTGGTQAGTHDHSSGHTNIASGVLRGSWGVEPVYGSNVFSPTNFPISYNVKRGDGGTGASILVSSAHVTREYQICLKCHSDYAYGANPPSLTNTTGGTSSGTNDVDQFTNQAMEFNAPASHQGQPASTTDSGASAAYSTNNHRSWHPVIRSTRRTPATGAARLTAPPISVRRRCIARTAMARIPVAGTHRRRAARTVTPGGHTVRTIISFSRGAGVRAPAAPRTTIFVSSVIAIRYTRPGGTGAADLAARRIRIFTRCTPIKSTRFAAPGATSRYRMAGKTRDCWSI
jgi:hypothetical protein